MVDMGAPSSGSGHLRPLLISLHMPKTAGTSFAAAMEEQFGDALLRDYGDFPLNEPPAARHRRAVQASLTVTASDVTSLGCIHGHFLPLKYLLLADLRACAFVTWLREPVSRLISHYYYWLEAYDPGSPDVRPLHRQVVEERWSLEKFCLSPELRNVYSQFLWGFPLESFDFIGITEHYTADLQAFTRRYELADSAPQLLNSRETSASETLAGKLSEVQLQRIRKWHAADMDLYARALDLRTARVVNR